MFGNGNVKLMRGVSVNGSIVIDLLPLFIPYWKNDLQVKTSLTIALFPDQEKA